MANQIL